MTQLERLVQEHAIYKAFFEEFMDREQNSAGTFVQPFTRMKEKAFDVCDRLKRLNRNIPYYDPSWTDADKALFTVDVKNLIA